MAKPIHPQARARKRYNAHRRQAKFRGILWLWDYTSWCEWWRQQGYDRNTAPIMRHVDSPCMARYGDEGPYSPDNVYLTTRRENVVHAQTINNKNAQAIPVVTPLGRFASFKQASHAHNVSPSTIRNWINSTKQPQVYREQ